MASNTKMSLKLLVDKKSKKVLYAEAGKEFVDFLFGLLQMPLGSIMGFLVEQGMAGSGSLGKVYESVINTIIHTYGSTREVGYVKGAATYMVMDDLTVKPLSTISSITLLSTYGVKDVGDLQEKLSCLTQKRLSSSSS